VNFVAEHLAGRPDLIRQVFEWAGVERGRRIGKEWRVTCPFHCDEHPSLDIDVEKAAFLCRACQAGGDAVDFYARARGMPADDAIRELRERLGLNGSRPATSGVANAARRTPVRRIDHEIRGTSGELVATHHRYEYEDRPKSFSWSLPDRSPNLGGLPTSKLPLYGSEKIAAWHRGTPIILTEGEKKADILTSRGYCVLATVTGSSGTPGATVLEPLRDCDVVLWPDNDGPGHEHMKRIAALLVGVAKSVRILQWGERPKDDVADFFLRGGTVEQLDRMLAETKKTEQPKRSPWRSFTLSQLEEMKIPERELIVTPFLGRQETSFTYGPKGHGKTWKGAGCAVIAAQGGGAGFLNFTAPGPGVLALYVDGEMLSRDIRNRVRDVCRTGNLDPGDNLRIWTPDAQPDGSPRLNLFTEQGRSAFEDHVADIEDQAGRKVELVGLDNLRSLFPGWEENKAESFMPIGLWTIQLRGQGRSVMLFHHSNKQGEYSGNTAIVTHVHSIIRVSHPDGYRALMGAYFDVNYEYTRAKPEGLDNFNARLEGDVWTVKELGHASDEMVRILIGQEVPYRDIADQLGISKWSVEQVARKMKEVSR